MFKYFLFLFLTISLYAQTFLEQGFESTTFPPTGWTQTGSYLSRVTSSTYPTASPHSGAGMLQFNSFTASNGTVNLLVSPAIDLSSLGTNQAKLEFWFYKSSAYPTYNDWMEVFINTAGDTSSGLLGYTYRVSTNNEWVKVTYDIPVSNNVAGTKLIFKFHSKYGNNIYVDDIKLYLPANMSYSSSNTFHPTTSVVSAGTNNNQILKIEVVTTGSNNPLNVTQFNLSTNGSTNASTDITAAKIYYTGTTNAFSTSTLFGTQNNPSGAFIITGTQTLQEGTNYFWLTYDISTSAGNNNVVDAECSSITVGGTPQTPTSTAPSGNRTIKQPITGIKTIGNGGDYTTFAAAMNDLNILGVGTGGVTFNVPAGTTFTNDSIYIAYQTTQDKPIIIQKSGTGANPKILKGGDPGVNLFIVLNGAKYVTIDGIDLEDNSTNGGMDWGIYLWGGAKWNTFKNMTIKLKKENYYATGVETDSYDAADTNQLNSYNNFLNINLVDVCYPYYMRGKNDGTLKEKGNVIGITTGGSATISNAGDALDNIYGIYMYAQEDFQIYKQNITLDTSATKIVRGIYIHNYCNNGKIYNNKIQNIITNTSSSYSYNSGIFINAGNHLIYANEINNLKYKGNSSTCRISGIYIADGKSKIYNNFISNVSSPNGGTGNYAAAASGIYYSYSSDSGFVYNNTIYLNINGSGTNASNNRFVGIYAGSGFHFRAYNNIIKANATGTFARLSGIEYGGTTVNTTTYVKTNNNIYNLTASDTNKYYVFYNTSSAYKTIANVKSTFSNETNGQVFEVPMVNPANHDLHLNLTGIDSRFIGMPVGFITTDIDGDPRHPQYPYIGADENTAFILPVELASFVAELKDEKIVISWETVSEINTDKFVVEKNYNGNWISLGSVKAAGNSNTNRKYEYVDEIINSSNVSYRLKLVDNDGSYKYSQVVELTNIKPKKYQLMQNYPNPFNPTTRIRFALPEKTNVSLKLYNILGQEVMTIANGEYEAGYHTLDFNASGLTSGVYVYRIEAGKFTAAKKMMLMK